MKAVRYTQVIAPNLRDPKLLLHGKAISFTQRMQDITPRWSIIKQKYQIEDLIF